MTKALLHTLRTRLAFPRSSWQLTLLGLFGGLAASLVIVCFLFFIRLVKALFAQLTQAIPPLEHSVPLIGAAIIFVIASLLGLKYYRLGIPFVIYRLRTHNGSMPLKNTINQFIGAGVALASGFVVGREGPAVHLGAAGSGWIGLALKLPHNATRVLCASGIAAGIAASFNTPLAAVIFVMEVVLKEYRMHMVLPVLIAASCGAIVHNLALSTGAELHLTLTYMPSLDWPLAASLMALGIILGLCSVLFGSTLIRIMKVSYHLQLKYRLLLAGSLTGFLTWLMPDLAMTEVEAVMMQLGGGLEFKLIAALFVGKLLATTVALGLGIPGGIIGPLYTLGALAAGAVLATISQFGNVDPALIPFFIIIGMGSMMAASLHAPMAAMVAILEMTNRPDVMVPAMLVMVPAHLMVSQIFNMPSIFMQQMKMQGMAYDPSPVHLNLQKTGALAVVEKDFQWLDEVDEMQQVKGHLLAREKGEDHDRLFFICPGTGERLRMEGIDQQCSLAMAYQRLARHRKGAVYVYGNSRQELLGIISWKLLSKHIHQEVA